MPTINKGQLLDAIGTVQQQSSGNWRLIVGGDGWIPDNPFEDDRIDTVGIPATREAGFVRNKIARLVNTEWIGFLDDDDELLPHYVSTWESMKDTCDVMIFQMDNYGELLPPTNNYELQHGRVGISFAMKRQLLLDNPFDGQGNGEDYRLLYVLKNSGYSIAFLNVLGYLVRPYLKRI